MVDLQLESFEALYEELKNRCDSALFVYTRTVDSGCPIIDFKFEGGTVNAIGLCEAVKAQLLVAMWEGDPE